MVSKTSFRIIVIVFDADTCQANCKRHNSWGLEDLKFFLHKSSKIRWIAKHSKYSIHTHVPNLPVLQCQRKQKPFRLLKGTSQTWDLLCISTHKTDENQKLTAWNDVSRYMQMLDEWEMALLPNDNVQLQNIIRKGHLFCSI